MADDSYMTEHLSSGTRGFVGLAPFGSRLKLTGDRKDSLAA